MHSDLLLICFQTSHINCYFIENRNVHLFRFDLPLSTDTLGCAIGKHIFVKIGNVERAYTPITTDFDKGHFDLAIKVLLLLFIHFIVSRLFDLSFIIIDY